MQLDKNKILTLLLIVQIIFVKFIANHAYFIEKYYSNGIYKYVSSALRFLFGWLPFSIGDILYFIVIVYLFVNLIKFLKRQPKKWNAALFSITAKLSIAYFIFHLFWGFNYYRLPLQKIMQLKMPKYHIDDLNLLTEKLLLKAQEIHFNITNNDTLPIVTTLSKKETYANACTSYKILSKKHPQFRYTNKKVKNSIFSLPLTYMGFAGYLNPFTNEAQVNYKVPAYMLPAIATHEIAHQLGYASESEANFIGFLATVNSDNLRFNYSGYIMALRYCLREIYTSDKALYIEFVSRLPIGVKKNLQEHKIFRSNYKNPLEPLFKKFYDLFLKSNNQKNGIQSYGKMVGLLIAYESQNKL